MSACGPAAAPHPAGTATQTLDPYATAGRQLLHTVGLPISGAFVDADTGFLLIARCPPSIGTTWDPGCTYRLIATHDGGSTFRTVGLPNGGVGLIHPTLQVFGPARLVLTDARVIDQDPTMGRLAEPQRAARSDTPTPIESVRVTDPSGGLHLTPLSKDLRRWSSSDGGGSWAPAQTVNPESTGSVPPADQLLVRADVGVITPPTVTFRAFAVNANGQSYALTGTPDLLSGPAVGILTPPDQHLSGTVVLPSDTGHAWFSSDHGRTWTQCTTPHGWTLSSLLGTDGHTAFAYAVSKSSPGGGYLTSTDAGRTWDLFTLPPGIDSHDPVTLAPLPAGGELVTDTRHALIATDQHGTQNSVRAANEIGAIQLVANFGAAIVAITTNATTVTLNISTDGTTWRRTAWT